MKFKKITKLIKKKKLIIFFITLLFISILFWFYPLRLDLTSNRKYSLSPTTKKTIKNLDGVINIKVFSSQNLPSRFLFIKQVLKDWLMEYQFVSKGKIRIEWVDVDNNDEGKQEAQKLGIPPLQFSDLKKDKVELTQGFFGLAFLFNDEIETTPLVDRTSDLEYQLTSKIHKITQDKQPRVGFVIGHGEQITDSTNIYQESLLKSVLADQFLTEFINLDQEESELIPDSFDIIIIVGPDQEFTIKEKYLLDQFLMKGKPIIFLLETQKVSENLQVLKADHKLEDLLSSYGVNLKSGFVLDTSNEKANFSSGISMFFIPYPFWVKIKPENINYSSPITSDLQSLVFPWTSWIEYDQNDSRIIPLISSSNESWTEEKNINLDPTQDFNLKEGKSKNLAVIFDGKLESFFKDKDKPLELEQERFIDKIDKTRFALIADADFVNEGMITRAPENLYFFVNLVEYLANGQEFAKIRIKAEDTRPLKELTDKEREFYKYLNILGVPIVIGLIGFVFLFWHNQKKYIL